MKRTRAARAERIPQFRMERGPSPTGIAFARAILRGVPRGLLTPLLVVSLTILGLASGCSSEPVEHPLYPMPFKAADGKLQVFDGKTWSPLFIKGMNMGVALPGTQAGELAVTTEDYDAGSRCSARWASMPSASTRCISRASTSACISTT